MCYRITRCEADLLPTRGSIYRNQPYSRFNPSPESIATYQWNCYPQLLAEVYYRRLDEYWRALINTDSVLINTNRTLLSHGQVELDQQIDQLYSSGDSGALGTPIYTCSSGHIVKENNLLPSAMPTLTLLPSVLFLWTPKWFHVTLQMPAHVIHVHIGNCPYTDSHSKYPVRDYRMLTSNLKQRI